ncbi:hypothetical protein Moror_2989 [Moniliophthora roreri MCA 2997]|uniref:Uncharacterized protein n=1 Tax=Moniliophthora roreri (strain MCA 2997) TaxID=1381753 RepID=V2X4K5_MONRO|nr:hypothetical protein Moror_2989 [Moniliophthora roreri MCA 2997]
MHSCPSPIRVVDRNTFKRLFDDVTPTPSPVESQASSTSPTDTIPKISISLCPGRIIHCPSTTLSTEVPNNQVTSEADVDDDDIIDLRACMPLDDDDDDSDITPPATPHWCGFGEHVRLASGSGEQHYQFLEHLRHQPSFYLQRRPFLLHSPKTSLESRNSATATSIRTWSGSKYDMPSPAHPRSAIDLCREFGSGMTETKKGDCIARRIEYSELGPPEFTNPFVKNKALELLPRLKKSDYKPLPKKFLRNSVSPARTDHDDLDGEMLSATLLCIPKRMTTAGKSVLVYIPHTSRTIEPEMVFSPHDRGGMSSNERKMLRLMHELFPDIVIMSTEDREEEFSPHDGGDTTSNERRMLRLMRELFPDIAATNTENPGKLSCFVNYGEPNPSIDALEREGVIHCEAVNARGAEEVWEEIVL